MGRQGERGGRWGWVVPLRLPTMGLAVCISNQNREK